jgi:energy-coupling factor transport system permease protein
LSQELSIYVARASGAHRLHPTTKLTLAGLLLISGLVLPGSWPTYILFLGILSPLALWGQVLRELYRTTLRVGLPFATSVFLIQGFLWPGGTPIFSLGPFSLKEEGLAFAAASTGRILLVVGSFIWFALTTRPDTLMIALVQRGFPANLAYIIVATIQIVPRFQARATAILDAQHARGLETEGGFRVRVKAVVPLVVPLILSSLVDVEERALAIEARGFSHPGVKTSLEEIYEAPWERFLRWSAILAAGAAIGFRVWWQIGR